MSQNRLCKRYSNVIFTAAILLSVGVMVSLCFNNSVWFDEAYSTFMARQSYWGIIEQNLTDVHPPLYYFVLKLVTSVFGYNLLVMKLVSVAGVTATMVLGATLVRRRFGDRAGLLFILLFLCGPCMLSECAAMVRMYSWAMFFVTASGLLAYEIYEAPTKAKWIFFVLASVAGMYTHTYALIAIGFVYLFLLVAMIRNRKGRLRGWILCAAATFVLYAPWFFVLLRQVGMVSGNYWIAPLSLSSFAEYAKFLFLPGKLSGNPAAVKVLAIAAMAGLVLAAVLFAVWCVRGAFWKKRKIDRAAFLALGVFLLPAVLGIGFSLAVRPVFIARYLLPGIGLFWLFFAIEASRLKKGWLAAFLCCVLLSGGLSYNQTFQEEYFTKTDEAVSYLKEEVGREDVFLTNLLQLGEQGGPLAYYFPEQESWCYQNGEFFKHYTNGGGTDVVVSEDQVEGVNGTFWYLCDPKKEPETAWFTDRGYTVTKEKSTGIDLYSFDVYRIVKE